MDWKAPLHQALHRLLQLLPKREAPPEETAAAPSTVNHSGKRPKNFKMPPWALKDWFAKKDLGTMVPPEELREAEDKKWGTYGMSVGPLGSSKPGFEKVGPLKSQRKSPGAQQEVSQFLDQFLDPEDSKEDKDH